MSIIGSMNIAQQALNVNSIALNVVSNNVANMNTEGYLKQRVELEELEGYLPYSSSKGIQIYRGGGVGISDITQYTDNAMLGDINDKNSDLSKLTSMLDGLGDLENVLNEMGKGGLSAVFSDFYSAVQLLTEKPNDSSMRLNFATAAKEVAEKFNEISNSLTKLQSNLVGNIDSPQSVYKSEVALIADDVNSKLKQIAQLNGQIIATASGGSYSNELITQRNNLLNELSGLVDFSATQNSNGTINISIGGFDIVEGSTQKGVLSVEVGTTDNPAVLQIKTNDEKADVKVADLASRLDGGTLKGIIEAVSGTGTTMSIAKVQSEINLLAKSFATEVNAIQRFNDGNTAAMAIGTDADGKNILIPSEEDIFVMTAGTEFNAGNITLNEKIFDNPNLIAAARVEIDVDGNPLDNRAIGNTNNLKEFLGLQDKNIAGLGGVTFASYLNNIVGKVGLQVQELTNEAEAQSAILEQATTNFYSLGGVNLDEELMDMIKYQRAYEASSRIFSVCNQMLQVLVQLGE